MSVEGLPVDGNAGAVRGVEMNTPNPKTWLAIDFETYYDANYSVAALGYSAYCADQRFAATLVAICDGETSEACHPSAFDWTKIADKELVAHNAAFDKAVFAALQQRGIIPAGIKPVAWHCTADMCAYFGVPRSLAQAAEVLLGVKLDKSVRDAMKGGGDLFTSPDKFTEYAAADAKACAMLWAKFSKWWPEDERELSDLTRRMGERGLYLDRSKTTDIFQGLEDTIESAKMTLPWKGPATSPKAIEAHCKAHGIEPPANTNAKGEELEEWLEKHGDTPPARAIKAVQEIRSLNRSAKVLETMLERIRPDGRIDAHTMYFGAATGRWSGGGHGLNLQNLNRGDAGTADIRGCITAAPGHKLLIMDLSQIEPRCLAWAAGDRAWLDLVRSGMNPYEAHAMTAHGWKGKKLKQENPRLYALCKAERLGLGYGCGADKFVLVAKLLGGLEVTPAESKKIVSEFRASNQCIVKFWDSLEAAFTARDGQDYRMPLPSGRRLRYADVKVEDMTASVLKGGPRTKLYGGKLCENFVQAMARDVFAEGLARAEYAGLNPILTVHDEIICEVPEEKANAGLDLLRLAMCHPPSWAPDLPVAAEGEISEHYKK